MTHLTSVTYLDPHTNMTVDEALSVASRSNMTDVLVLGYDVDGDLIVTSSHMDNGSTIFMLEVLKHKMMEEVK